MILTPAESVQIHLTGTALLRAKLATRKARGIRAALRYTGPHFKSDDQTDIIVGVGGTTINVIVRAANADLQNTYVYPLHTVGRVRIKE